MQYTGKIKSQSNIDISEECILFKIIDRNFSKRAAVDFLKLVYAYDVTGVS